MSAATTTAPATTTEHRYKTRTSDGRTVRLDGWQHACDAETEALAATIADLDGDPRDDLRRQAEAIAEACGVDLDDEPYATTTDVLGWVARASEMDLRLPSLDADDVKALRRLEVVPNARLRAEVERRLAIAKAWEETDEDELGEHPDKGLLAQVARSIGAGTPAKPDTTHVRRLLGFVPDSGSKGYEPTLRLFIPYEVAVKFADALGLDYHHVGV